ncbi:MAG: hypothetical protein WKF78_10655 [Candidatus Limnocylindrales bacterium]
MSASLVQWKRWLLIPCDDAARRSLSCWASREPGGRPGERGARFDECGARARERPATPPTFPGGGPLAPVRNPPRPIVRAGPVQPDRGDRPGPRVPGLRRGAVAWGVARRGDLRVLAVALYIGIVLLSGTIITYFVVPRPTGAAGPVAGPRRSAWSAALGFFASVPIAYLVMVLATQIVRPPFDA